MSTFTDLEKDAASVDGLVNENGLIPTRRNGPKPSYQYLVDGWNAEIAATILELNKSRGFRVVGTFADGFTYELFNDVGIDADGNSWIYVGVGAPNKVVSDGTVPSIGEGYQQVTFNSASSISTMDGSNVQEKMNYLDGGVYVISSSAWGLVKGTQTAAPYSQQQWDDAYNNGVRITNAINYARDKGFSEIVLEYGSYPLTYYNTTGTNSLNAVGRNGCLNIKNCKGVKINLNGSTLFAIFDSDTRNPYDLGTSYNPRQLRGNLIVTSNVESVTICNGFLVGERLIRSFSNEDLERREEQTYGVRIGSLCYGVEIKNINGGLFMGDTITSSEALDGYTYAYYGEMIFNKGGVDLVTGGDTATAGEYTSDFIDISSSEYEKSKYVTLNTLGDTQMPLFRSYMLVTSFYNSSGDYLGYVRHAYAQPAKLIDGASSVRFTAYDDERTDASVTYLRVGHNSANIVSMHSSKGVQVEDCFIYSNNRGGVSNMPCSTSIVNVDFEYCGSNRGLTDVPEFHDTTRYAINMEDFVSDDLTIENCTIKGTFNPIIIANGRLSIDNVKLDNCVNGIGIAGTYSANICNINARDMKRLFSVSFDFDYLKRSIVIDTVNTYDVDEIFAIDENPSAIVKASNVMGEKSALGRAAGVDLNDVRISSDKITDASGVKNIKNSKLSATNNTNINLRLLSSTENANTLIESEGELRDYSSSLDIKENYRELIGYKFKSGKTMKLNGSRDVFEDNSNVKIIYFNDCHFDVNGIACIVNSDSASNLKYRFVFNNCKISQRVNMQIVNGDTSRDEPIDIYFINCDIEIDPSLYSNTFKWISVTSAGNSPVSVDIWGCTFRSYEAFSGDILKVFTAGAVTLNMQDNKFYNVTFTDSTQT